MRDEARRLALTPVPPPPDEPNEKYDALIERQIALADKQLAEFESGATIRRWSPVVRYVQDVLKAAFEVSFALAILAALAASAVVVWNAAHEKGLVIESFSVPADFAAKGMTGQALAAQLLDEMASLQEATDTARAADSYSNDWGDTIRIEIPRTGMSIGEAYRLLVSWLGNETRITGEVFRDAQGIAIRTRVGGAPGVTVKGAEADLDSLMRRAAEAIYRRTQPYRYSVYASDSGRRAESLEVLRALAEGGPAPRERAWAYLGLGEAKSFSGDWYGGVADLRRAAALAPGLASLYVTLDSGEAWLGHDEEVLKAAKRAVALLEAGGDTGMSERSRTISLPMMRADVALASQDYAAALKHLSAAARLPDYASLAESARENIALAHALMHDGAAMRAAWRALPATDDPLVQFSRLGIWFSATAALGDWPALLAREEEVEARIAAAEKANPGLALGIFRKTLFRPALARAHAMTGDLGRAHALIGETPLDCVACLRARGAIAAAARNWAGSGYWYARAAKAAPSIAAVYAEWGRMLLAKGDAGGAIVKLRVAAAKAPRYADPYEAWGEALMAQNRSDLALEKLAEAARRAPNWGRLHLKRGEALWWLGRKDDARAAFARARQLQLTAAERRELAVFR